MLIAVPGVREAAVIGEPDPLLGEAVVAHVSPDPGEQLDAGELRRRCAARLEDFKVPRRVEIRAQLPRTDNGKVDRRALLALPVDPPG